MVACCCRRRVGCGREYRRLDPQPTCAPPKTSDRTHEFTPERPTDWRPGDVPNPDALLLPEFDDNSAWELIASKLEAGHDVEAIILDQPPGKKGYVMKINLNPGRPLLYVKLELGSGVVIGRSFHESE